MSRRHIENIDATIQQSARSLDPSEYISLAKAAPIARVSEITLRRAIRAGVISATPYGPGRGLKVRRGDALELRDKIRRQSAPTVAERTRELGVLTAKTFRLFDQGAPFAKMCIDLEIDADTLESLYRQWERMRLLTKFAEKDRLASAPKPAVIIEPFIRPKNLNEK